MSLGPWFKCFPGEFLNGMRDMDARKQGFYCQIIFRMYEAADAIYADDRTIGRWCNSNKRPWEKIRDELIAEGRLVILPDGGLINPRALREMTEQAERNSQVPDFIRERLAKLSQMFGERFEKESQKIRETSRENTTKTDPLIEARSQKPEIDKKRADDFELVGEAPAKPKKKVRRTRLSPDWKPTEQQRLFALSKGIHETRLPEFIEQFVNYRSSADAEPKKDWPAVWRTECITKAKYYDRPKRGNVTQLSRQRPQQPSSGSAFLDGAYEAADAIDNAPLPGRDRQEFHGERARATGSFERGDCVTLDALGNVVPG